MRAIVPSNREANVKVLLALALGIAALVPVAANAGTLLTGVVRDTDGAAVVGARIRALDAAGRALGTDRAAADGTFALEAVGEPTQLEISCAFCVRVRVDARASIVIVRRYAVLRDAPLAPADLAVLPYRRFAQLATLVPYALATGSEVADRGLDRGRGALVVDGVPLYRATDGASSSDLIVPMALANLIARTPLDAPRYGTYAQGGVVDASTIGMPLVRIDGGDAFDASARVGAAAIRATVASARDVGDRRGNAMLAADLRFAGGMLSARAIALGDSGQSLRGASLGYTTASRRARFSSRIAARESSDSSFVDAVASVDSRGTIPIELGIRASRSTGILAEGSSGSQVTQAIVLAADAHAARADTRVSVAYERASNSLLFGANAAAALTSSVAETVRFGDRFQLHGGVLGAFRAPTLIESERKFSGDRSMLVEVGATYTDNARLRVGATAYNERIAGASGRRLSGIGIDGTWQIAPALALRAWTLANSARIDTTYARPANAPTGTHRRVVWLTAGGALRVDLLARGGPFEGDVRVPFGAYAATLGSSMQAGVRVTTLGIGTR